MTKTLDMGGMNKVLNVLADTAAALAFTTVVRDDAGAPVFHVDGSATNQLIITVTNQTSGKVNVAQLSGTPAAGNANVILKMPFNQIYFDDAPTINASGCGPGTWVLATDAAQGSGWVDTFFLANTGTCILGPNGEPDDTLTLTINYGGAVPDDPQSINLTVLVSYDNIQTASGVPLQGSTPPQTLGLMANAGEPSPLIASFIGPNTVLNDGMTLTNLTLRLVNTSSDPMQFVVPPAGQPTQTYIELTFPVADAASDAIWALTTTSAWKSVALGLAGPASTGWTVTPSISIPGVLELRPDFKTVSNIPPGGRIDLTLQGITSSLTPGVVQVQVSVCRFALYGTQTIGVAAEKTPLVYSPTLTSCLTLSAGSLGANNGLQVLGDSSVPLVNINQAGTGPALQVAGGSGTNALQVSGGITVDYVSAGNISAGPISASGVSVNGSVVANSANVSGQVLAATVGATGQISAGNVAVSGAITATGQISAGSVLASGAITATGQIGAGNVAVSGGISANSITTAGLTSNYITTGSLGVNGSFSANMNYASFYVDSAAGYGVRLCNAPDYSHGTVGIGGTAYSNYMLTLTNTQGTGMGIFVNAPNLGSSWWALDVHGGCINASGSWNQFADMRLKENVQAFDAGLAQVLMLDPIQYNFKHYAGLGSTYGHVGLSAQELQKIAPGMVGTSRISPDSEEEYLCIDNGPLTYMLINAVKELHAVIESMKTEMATLKRA